MIGLLFLIAFGGLSVLGFILGARWLEAEAWRRDLVAYRIGVPLGLSVDDVAAWLGHVVSGTHASRARLIGPPATALEVRATARGIEHVLITSRGMSGAALSALRAAIPGVRLSAADDYLEGRPQLAMAAEGRLTQLARPLAHERAERANAAMLSAMAPLEEGDTVLLQWIFLGAGAVTPATARGTAADLVATLLGVEGTPSDAEAVAAARHKQAEPLLQAVVRLGINSSSPARTYSLFGQVWGTLRGLNAPGVHLVRRHLLQGTAVRRITELSTPLAAWPLIINARELAGLVGLPLGEARLPGLPHAGTRQLPPSVNLPSRGTVMAVSSYAGTSERPLALATPDRLTHQWIIGPTGVGKSTLMATQIIQDIEAGRGVAVIDPKGGDLVADVLARVPEHRRDDVVVIDPSATSRPVGINILDGVYGEHAEELVVDHLIHLMGSLWSGSWGPRTSDTLRNALLALTHARTAAGGRFTLVELPELLLNASFRRFVMSQPTIPASVRPFFAAYEAMSDGERAQVIGPSLNKLRSFTTRTALRLMLGQDGGVQLSDVFTKRRILLVALPAGVIGTDTAALAGSLILAGLWQATLARVAVPAEKRHPVFIYLEFQQVLRLPLDLADMLAQSRAMGVGLVLAHQYLGQLSESIRTAVLGTVRTQVAFQIEHDDAKALAPRFAPLTPADLSGLAAYEIAMRPCVGGATLSPVTGRTLPLPEPTRDGRTLAQAARERYGRPRAEVEAALVARIQEPMRQQPEGRTLNGVRS